MPILLKFFTQLESWMNQDCLPSGNRVPYPRLLKNSAKLPWPQWVWIWSAVAWCSCTHLISDHTCCNSKMATTFCSVFRLTLGEKSTGAFGLQGSSFSSPGGPQPEAGGTGGFLIGFICFHQAISCSSPHWLQWHCEVNMQEFSPLNYEFKKQIMYSKQSLKSHQ